MGRLFTNGSVWLKADFHMHTRSDSEFRFEGDENYFISQYVGKMEEQGIRIGVIANHNKFNFEEYKDLRKLARKKEIYLMPGVELSIGDGSNGIHTILVFSDEWFSDPGGEYINVFLGNAFQGQLPSEYERKNGRTRKSILEVFDLLDSFEKDYFVIFAHVEQSGGLWDGIERGRMKELLTPTFKKRVLGFQKVRTHDVSDRPCRKGMKELFGEYYPAELEGSDCKNINDIGKDNGYSYIKLGAFTYEAVKYVLMDHDNRIQESPSERQHSYVIDAEFEGGIFDGTRISFSPELNTIIGIRGSGKSAILESLRYALNIPHGEKSQDLDYKKNLVQHALDSGGKIKVRAVSRQGVHYTVSRIMNDKPDVFANDEFIQGVSISETIIHKPIYFGQKDLSSSGEGFERDLVEKIIGEKLSPIRDNILKQRQVLKNAATNIGLLSEANMKMAELIRVKSDLEHRLKVLKDYGIEEKIQKQTGFDSDYRKIKDIWNGVKSYLDALDEVLSEYEDDLKNNTSYQSKQNPEFFEEYFKIYEDLIEIFSDIKTNIQKSKEVQQLLLSKSKEFTALKEALKDEFAEIQRKVAEELKGQGNQSVNLEEFRTWIGKLDETVKVMQVVKKQQENEIKFTEDLAKQIRVFNDICHEEFKAIKEIIKSVNDNHSSLSIECEFKGDKKQFLNYFKMMVKGSGIREERLAKLVEENSDFGGIYDFIRKEGKEDALYKNFMSNLDEFLSWQVPNKFIIRYQGKELREHSLGQRASALILFVLSQAENDLIIVDQPEDDLDNQTIYQDVIKLIKQIKPHTQFIFATHNPNIPVLGDADQVISCKYIGGSCEIKEGSIDEPAMQEQIVNIMEGGLEAISKRKEIYELWT